MKLSKSIFFLIVILIFSFASRIYNISSPNGYYFDEQYHVPAAKLFVDAGSNIGDVRFFEWWHGSLQDDVDCIKDTSSGVCINNYDWLHPPLAKYFQAIFMKILGSNALGWRMSSVVFGTMLVAATYGLAVSLFDNKKIALLASALLSLDGLTLVQSRIAMNDIQLSFWIVLATWSYVRFGNNIKQKGFLLLTGFFLGLSLATKWSGVFVLGALLVLEISHIISWARKKYEVPSGEKVTVEYKKNIFPYALAKLHWVFFSLFLVPLGIYFLTYIPMFLQGKSVAYFIELHKQIITYQINRDDVHPHKSHPLQWVINSKPVKYWEGKVMNGDGRENVGVVSNIYAIGNPIIHLSGVFVVFKVCMSIWNGRKSKDRELVSLFFILVMYLSTWLPWFFSPRILFYYHYTPAIPLLSIVISYWLTKNSKKNTIYIYLVFVLFFFMLLYPYWTGLPVSKNLASRVYFVFRLEPSGLQVVK